MQQGAKLAGNRPVGCNSAWARGRSSGCACARQACCGGCQRSQEARASIHERQAGSARCEPQGRSRRTNDEASSEQRDAQQRSPAQAQRRRRVQRRRQSARGRGAGGQGRAPGEAGTVRAARQPQQQAGWREAWWRGSTCTAQACRPSLLHVLVPPPLRTRYVSALPGPRPAPRPPRPAPCSVGLKAAPSWQGAASCRRWFGGLRPMALPQGAVPAE